MGWAWLLLAARNLRWRLNLALDLDGSLHRGGRVCYRGSRGQLWCQGLSLGLSDGSCCEVARMAALPSPLWRILDLGVRVALVAC